jgi:hypothetical protein
VLEIRERFDEPDLEQAIAVLREIAAREGGQ